ncbi:Plant calmodulin-binding protein-related [Euphorbia peplus]|nr:Plant calmodulin-binding protein-related [Euphorbia peplus]
MTEPTISLPDTLRTSDSDAGNSRRFSTGRSTSSQSGEKVVPNYLRASTGSCHDFCKYGKNHGFEEKSIPPWLRRKAKKPPDQEISSNFQAEESMMLKVKHKPNSNPAKVPEVIKGEVPPISRNRRASLSSSGTAANKMPPRVLLSKSVDSQNPVLRDVLAKKKTAGREVLTESIDSQRSVSSENRFERKGLAPERQQTVARKLLSKSVDSQSSISGEFERRKTDVLERKKALRVPEQKRTIASRLLTKSVDSQSSVSEEFERRKADALERKKASTTAIKLRTSLDSATRLSPKTVKQDKSSSSSSPSGRVKVSLKQVSTKVINENMSAKRASSSMLRLSLPDSSRISSGGRNSDTTTAKKTVHVSPKASLSSKSSSIGIVKGQANPKASLSLKPTLKVQLSSRALLSPKTTSSGTPRAVASPRASLSNKSLARVPSLNTRNRKGFEVPSPLQNQSKSEKGNNKHPEIKQADSHQFTEELERPNNDAAEEKTLYIIKMETGNKILENDHNESLSAKLSSPPLLSAKSPSLPESSMSSSHNEEDEEESEYTVADTEDELVSEFDETDSVEAHPLEGEQKRWNRKTGLLHAEDKNDEPFKLRFRQGRVIDIQPEHNTPRRLKFRQGRAMGENQGLKSEGRRSFKRRADGHANDSKPSSEKVVLRHQDGQGKKDAQGLFNNVIEETASKLAETRKSKVKALVGAFETVISLQDRKPSGNTVS